MRLVRTVPSPATVIAAAALLVALGGTSVAAVSQLPRNSVGNAQLKANAVTSAKVKNGSLLKADFRSGQLPAGPTGPQGPPGPPGMSAREDILAETGYDSVSPKTIKATCSAGKKVVGGGVEVGGTGRGRVTVTENLPAGDNAWEAEAFEAVATGQTWKLEVHAICVAVAP
ncbi:MAG TPA: hypothetical protein VI409_04090 [Gaiellaceae bacterium]|nr:hypothetical protein [Gaiellaceae bacterium]